MLEHVCEAELEFQLVSHALTISLVSGGEEPEKARLEASIPQAINIMTKLVLMMFKVLPSFEFIGWMSLAVALTRQTTYPTLGECAIDSDQHSQITHCLQS